MAKTKVKPEPTPVVDETVKGVEFSDFELSAQAAKAARERMRQLDVEEAAAIARQRAVNVTPPTDPQSPFNSDGTRRKVQGNPSITIPPKTAEVLAAEVKPKINQTTYDPLTASLPPALRELYGIPTAPAVAKPSITLPSKPAVQGTWGQRGADAPLSPTEQRQAELQQRPTPPAALPTVQCSGFGARVASNLEYHITDDGSKCTV
jgi:hypothetical protein